MNRLHSFLKLFLIVGLAISSSSFAEVSSIDVTANKALLDKVENAISATKHSEFMANNIWMLLCTFLVFIMHLGFSVLESGLSRAKNTVNILFKNFAILSIGVLTYAALGFNLMYPGDAWMVKGWLGFAGFGITGLGGLEEAGNLIGYADGAYTYWTDFIFQAMFAATAATIVSGAVAERIKLSSFLVFSIIYVAIVYPIAGSWQWGGGWLSEAGFHDFAGSSIVHSVGGWAALACVIILGPRLGKYIGSGTRAILGHNMPLASIGVLLLWFGWFGFNGGSVLSADPGLISYVIVTTTLGAAVGTMSAMITSLLVQRKPDLTMVLNGALAGLVSITAGADVLSLWGAVVAGLIGGVIVVFSVIMLDKIKIDDPVGAISVHLVCGIWGTLAVGIFVDDKNIIAQIKGIFGYAVISFISAFVIFYMIKLVMGVRVSEIEEKKGLDLAEHGQESYSGFQIFSNK